MNHTKSPALSDDHIFFSQLLHIPKSINPLSHRNTFYYCNFTVY